jgi:hypothetical protein
VEPENKLFARVEIYRILTEALIKKTPLPPKNWSVVKFDEEVYRAGKEYDPDLHSRHRNALGVSIFYLVDFARRMPEWINLSTTNERVREMCGELADEIEQITYEPEAVIARHGKLKVWLKAKLAVQTCLIYREETTRNIAEQDEAKRLRHLNQSKINSPHISKPTGENGQSSLARQLFKKVTERAQTSATEQPSLF